MPLQQDFRDLNDKLLARIQVLLPIWLPGGKLLGDEYCCADLLGGLGDSLRVNIKTGLWADFATNDRGGDPISLYAAIRKISQGESFKELSRDFAPDDHARAIAIPADVKHPTMKHPRYGMPICSWTYRDEAGNDLFYVSRYETANGKQFLPWSYDGRKWNCRAWPVPRPLYNLDKLSRRPGAPVLIVEGEKCADAAEKLTCGAYVTTTWPNGAKAVRKSNWEFLRGRNVLIWPDNDEPGKRAAQDVIAILKSVAKEIKTLNTDGQPDGWDAADALAGGWEWDGFREWAKSHLLRIDVNIQANAVVRDDNTPEVSDGAAYAIWSNLGLTLSSTGNPIVNIDNVIKITAGVPDLKNLVWLDTFHKRIFTKWQSNDARPWTDTDTLKLCAYIQRELMIARMSKEAVFDAVVILASANERNEPRDWVESLVWDGKPRVDTFLCRYMSVNESEYVLAASRNFWVGIAARLFWPGCQLDNMLVLKGRQGARKSSALRIIGGKWYAPAGSTVLHKDFYEILQGKLIIEIAELSAFHNQEIEAIKNAISIPTDRFRVSYGRIAEDHARQCVFAGTTNDDKPLRDHTGGRRFWPITTKIIRVDEIEHDRSQLFAEAAHLYKEGSKWFEMPEAETEQVQEENRQEDAWEGVLDDALDGLETTNSMECAKYLGIGLDRLDRLAQMRISRCLRTIGFESKTEWKNGRAFRCWVRKTRSDNE